MKTKMRLIGNKDLNLYNINNKFLTITTKILSIVI